MVMTVAISRLTLLLLALRHGMAVCRAVSLAGVLLNPLGGGHVTAKFPSAFQIGGGRWLRNRQHRQETVRHLNRIMLEPGEVYLHHEDDDADGEAESTNTSQQDERRLLEKRTNRSKAFVLLHAQDARTKHIRGVLKARDGDFLRCGVLDAGKTDTAEVRWIPERSTKQETDGSADEEAGGGLPNITEVLPLFLSPFATTHTERNAGGEDRGGGGGGGDARGADGERKEEKKKKKKKEGPLSLLLSLGNGNDLLQPYSEPARPKVSMMLALPRPLQLERILPMVSSMGVDMVVLCSASKVEKEYFGSHLFRLPLELRAKLVEGLAQSGETALPRSLVVRRLKVFLEDDLDKVFPPNEYIKLIAHPTRLGESTPAPRVREAVLPPSPSSSSSLSSTSQTPVNSSALKVLVAVGPEGGWEEPYELDLFKQHGFQAVTLGTRVLRSDVACCSLLALAHDLVHQLEEASGSSAATKEQ